MPALSRAATGGLALLCLALMPRAAIAVELQPGLWESVETGTENGKPAKAEKETSCITPEEAKDPLKGLTKDTAGQCKTFDAKVTGGGLTVRLQCGQGKEFAIDMAVAYTFVSPTQYTGTIQSTVSVGGQKTVSDKKITARRIGDCKK
jgi:hypothetical protein